MAPRKLARPTPSTISRLRCGREKIQRIVFSYTSCSRSMQRSVKRIAWPMPQMRFIFSAGGSCQTDDSIGSSVKLTNRLTNTATTTVMPNG